MKIEAGSEYRHNVNLNSNDVWKFYQALYCNSNFEYYHGLTKEMVSCLYRETINGSLRNFYLKLRESCVDIPEDYKTVVIPDIGVIDLVLSKKVHRE